MSDILASLNPMQRKAAETTEGPVLILAGAGSGKTRVLTYRIAHLISELKVMPWNILAITFTNKAANEMKERVDRLLDEDGGKVWVATFHATCVRILRMHAELLGYTKNFTIYDTDDQKTLIRRVIKTLEMDEKMYPERAVLSKISAAKNEFISPDEMSKTAHGDFRAMRIADAYTEYQKQLMANDAMDFDDLLVKTVELFRDNPDVLKQWQQRFHYIMVDEYQDTNKVQFLFIKMLAAQHKNICVVGDDDQSIYKFRGADIRNILDFEETFAGTTVVKLEQNYRSTKNILDAANDVIKHNASRKAKTLWSDHDEGDKVAYQEFETGFDEAENVIVDIKSNLKRFAYGDVAVLYRTNAQSRLFEEKCVLYNVPYRLIGGVNFYQRREIKDIVAYLKTVASGVDDISTTRIINVPKRGIGATSVAKIADYARERGIGFFEALAQSAFISGINSGTAAKIDSFTSLIYSLREKAKTLTVKELIEAIIEDSGYKAELVAEKTVEAESRLENINELINKASELPAGPGDPEALSMFLEEVALIADVDTLDDDENRVVLMTLHGAKGLEFPRVYMVGMEEGLFPSAISIKAENSSEEVEEERRLCYVGITRAKEKLSLSGAHSRMVNGEMHYSPVSRFVTEISADRLESEKPVRQRSSAPNNYGGGRSYGGGKGYGGNSYGGGYSRSNSSGEFNSYGGETYVSPTAKADIKAAANASVSAYIGKEFKVEKATGLDYGVGDRVSHMKFGEGVVLAIEDGSRDFEVTVNFDGIGEKRMFASFAKLEKI